MSDPSVTPAAPDPVPDKPTDFDIAEEYGTARKNLPPAKILAICIGAVIIVVAIYALTHRAHATSSGSIDDVVAVAVPGQDTTMVAVNITLQNNSDKPAWIKTIQMTADVNGQKTTQDAAPGVDVQRYFQIMPDLKQHALDLLEPERRINPGEKISGTVVSSFPVKPDDFAKRKSLTVIVTPYDEVPVVIAK